WLSADPATIHELGSDANPYAYVKGRPLVAVDPDGRELVSAIVIGVVVGAVIAGGTNATIQYARTGRVSNWGWDGVAGAAVVGGVAGGLSGGVGAFVGGLFSSAVVGATVGGAAGGAAGAAGGYTAAWVLASALGRSSSWSVSGNTPFSLKGLGTSMLIGAGVGVATGALTHLITGPSSQAPEANTKVADAPGKEFDSAQEAAKWASSRHYDATQAQKVEYGGYIHKLGIRCMGPVLFKAVVRHDAVCHDRQGKNLGRASGRMESQRQDAAGV